MRTEEIMDDLKQKDNREFPREMIDAEKIDIVEYLNELLKAKGVTIPTLSYKLPYERSYLYSFFNNRRKPTRALLLQIAILLSLSTEETQRLLRIGQKAALYPRVPADAVVIYALEHKLSLDETDELLTQIGEAPFFFEPS